MVSPLPISRWKCTEPQLALHRKAIIHQVTAMLATSKNVLFPGHNHLLTTRTDDPSLAGARAIIKVSGHQYWWLAGKNRTFLEVASMEVIWWIVIFFAQCRMSIMLLPEEEAVHFLLSMTTETAPDHCGFLLGYQEKHWKKSSNPWNHRHAQQMIDPLSPPDAFWLVVIDGTGPGKARIRRYTCIFWMANVPMLSHKWY